MTKEQSKIERMYQSAMNLRDSTPRRTAQEIIDGNYSIEYRRIYNNNPNHKDVSLFRCITLEYRKYLRTTE
jgi:hypothetical protein